MCGRIGFIQPETCQHAPVHPKGPRVGRASPELILIKRRKRSTSPPLGITTQNNSLRNGPRQCSDRVWFSEWPRCETSVWPRTHAAGSTWYLANAQTATAHKSKSARNDRPLGIL